MQDKALEAAELMLEQSALFARWAEEAMQAQVDLFAEEQARRIAARPRGD